MRAVHSRGSQNSRAERASKIRRSPKSVYRTGTAGVPRAFVGSVPARVGECAESAQGLALLSPGLAHLQKNHLINADLRRTIKTDQKRFRVLTLPSPLPFFEKMYFLEILARTMMVALFFYSYSQAPSIYLILATPLESHVYYLHRA